MCGGGGRLPVGRYGTEQTQLWIAADDQVETARRLLAGRDGRGGVEVEGKGKHWDHTIIGAGGISELPRGYQGAPGEPRRCEQGETQWVHSIDGRCATRFRAGGQLAQGADVNKAAKAGQTRLFFASRIGHKDVVVTIRRQR